MLKWLGYIGGSIRVPAAFNFLYGLKPSHGRLPYAKAANSMEGQETVHSVCGPIAHSVEGKSRSRGPDSPESRIQNSFLNVDLGSKLIEQTCASS